MPRVEPLLLPVLFDLARGLRELRVPFGIVGALVPELLLDTRPSRMTNDADVTVVVESRAEFEALKDRLSDYGFTRTRSAHRLQHRDGGLVDLLPFSQALAPTKRLELEPGLVFNMAGFDQVVGNTLEVAIDGGLTVPLTPLPLYALLKMVAYTDRKAPKDLAGVLHCLEHYLEDDERRYGLEHDEVAVPFEFTPAYLLGLDCQRFLDTALTDALTAVLDRFEDADSQIVSVVAAETAPVIIDDDRRSEIFELFGWFRRGTGV
jgi:predicted nucleotidyltransferase